MLGYFRKYIIESLILKKHIKMFNLDNFDQIGNEIKNPKMQGFVIFAKY